MQDFIIREGKIEDIPSIWYLVRELAIYEKAPEMHTATVEEMEADGFGENPLYGFYVAEVAGEVIGMALYYYRYSTWKGKCLYLEDFYIQETHRGKKIGLALFEQIIRKAKTENCKRISWQVLDWNELAIDFYKKWEASFDGEWLNCALTEEQIQGFDG